MTKRLFSSVAMAVALLLPLAPRAQADITVADGTALTNIYNYNFGYYADAESTTQMVYPAEMLTDMTGGSITSLTLFMSANFSTTLPGISVKLKEVPETVVNYYGHSTTGATLVYTGSVTGSTGEVVFEFTTPYTYNGGNLLVSIETDGSSSSYWTQPRFYGITADNALYTDYYYYDYDYYEDDSDYFVDDVLPKALFEFTPASGDMCYRPNNLQVTDITESDATFSWTPRSGESEWMVYLDGEEQTSVTDTFYTFSSLAANTAYTAGVRAICGSGDSSNINNANFRTACTIYTQADNLPYTEDFNSYASGPTATIDPCWTKFTQYSSNYPYPSASNNHSGSGNSLYFYAGNSQYNYAVMSPFDDLNGLMLSFWTYIPTPSSAQLQVGTMTDPNDASTFSPIYITATTLTQSTWVEHEVLIPTGTTAQYLAFRNQGSASYTIYLDDITLMMAPECVRPSNISLSDITAESATVHIDDPTEVGNYVVILLENNIPIDTIETVDTVLDLTDLNAATNYSIKVYAICGDGTTTTAVQTNFITPCTSLTSADLPLTEDFQNYASGTQQISCWTRHTNYGSYPQTSTSTLTTYDDEQVGGIVYYMYTYNTSGAFLVSPYIDDLSGLIASCLSYPISSGSKITIGVMSDLNDTNTFVPITTGQPTSGWNLYEAYLSSVDNIEDYHYVAYRGTAANSSGGLYIDNLYIGNANGCAKPQSLALSDIETNSVTLTWSHPDEGTTFEVTYTAGGGEEHTVTTTATSYVIDQLDPSTTYTFAVRSICDDDNQSAYATIQATTLCQDQEVPYSEDFSSYSSSYSATDINCWTHLGGGYLTIETSYGASGNSMRFYPNGSTHADIAVLPNFDTPISELQLSFMSRAEHSSNSGSLAVGYITDLGDTSSFVELFSVDAATAGTSFSAVNVPFTSAPDGAHIVIAYTPLSTHTNYYWYIDDVQVTLAGDDPEPQPEVCNVPTNVHSTATTTNSITLDWGGTAASWKLSVNNGTDQAVSSHPYTITGLAAGTTYSIRVKAVCADGQESSYSNAISVSTEEEGTEPQPEVCDVPTNVHSTAATTTSITLDWSGTAASWKVSIDGGADQTVSSHPYTITGLTASTTYSIRVKAVCDGGQESDYSAAINANTEAEQPVGIDGVAYSTMNLYPNPASGAVSISGIEAGAQVNIVDINGRTLRTITAQSSTVEMSLEGFVAGTYFVRIAGAEGTATNRLVVR